jgi:hypothetical protein
MRRAHDVRASLLASGLMALAAFVLSVTRAATCDYSLCEDFEGVETGRAPDPHIWKLNTGDGSTIVVDDAHAVRGTKSARVQVTRDRQWAYMETTAIFPEAANGFWGRLYLRLDSERTGEGLVHWNIVEAVAERDPIKMYRYGGISIPELGRNYFNWNHEMRPRPPGFNELGVDDDFDAHVEAGVWHCLEWLFDPETDTSRFFWNGDERSALNVAGMANTVAFDMPPLRALNVGFTVYQPIARDFTVWIDEIAVSNSRIGCLP